MKAFCLLTVFVLSLTASAQPTSPRPPRGTPGAPSTPAATASDLHQVTDTAIRKDASSVVAWVCASKLTPGVGSNVSLATTPLTQYTTGGRPSDVCPSQPFRGQPQAVFCTGVLVSPYVVATSATCLKQAEALCECSKTGAPTCDGFFTGANPAVRAVFGFDMLDAAKARTSFAPQDVYTPRRIIKQASSAGYNWALIALDRNVTQRTAAPLRTDKVGGGENVLVVGNALGLPTKVTSSKVLDNNNTPFFTLVPGKVGALPGSPVFNARTHVIEGLVARDPATWSCANGCCQSTLPPGSGASATVTRSTLFLNAICESGTLCGTTCVNTLEDPGNCGRCGKACPQGQSCSKGRCQGCTSNTACNDNNPCTEDTCTAGRCANTPKQCPTGATCNATTGVCACPAGPLCGNTCCASGTSCINGTCQVPPQCTTDANCADGKACTITLCINGTCQYPTNCPTGMSCGSTGACVCTSGVACGSTCCASGNTCVNGTCQAPQCTTDSNCDDGKACTTNRCVNGRCEYPTNCASGSTCAANGTCVDACAGVTCGSNPCWISQCVNGQCVGSATAAGTTCEDGNACTSGDTCDGNGNCRSGPVRVGTTCNVTHCQTFTCDITGSCSVAGPTKVCDQPWGPCWQDTGYCDPMQGCRYDPKPNGTSCEDGNPCTPNDTCQAGLCRAGGDEPTGCTSPPACRTALGAYCSAHLYCVYGIDVGASCDDGNPATTGETCDSAGNCTAATFSK